MRVSIECNSSVELQIQGSPTLEREEGTQWEPICMCLGESISDTGLKVRETPKSEPKTFGHVTSYRTARQPLLAQVDSLPPIWLSTLLLHSSQVVISVLPSSHCKIFKS
jgi:hypothetical protein